MQKHVKEDHRVEKEASWEKFFTSISLETDPSESWHKIKNFLKPKGQRDYPTLRHDKAPLFVESGRKTLRHNEQTF